MNWSSDMSAAPRDREVDLWWDDGMPYRLAHCRYKDHKTWLDDVGNIVTAEFITHWIEIEPPATDGEE